LLCEKFLKPGGTDFIPLKFHKKALHYKARPFSVRRPGQGTVPGVSPVPKSPRFCNGTRETPAILSATIQGTRRTVLLVPNSPGDRKNRLPG